MSDYLKASIASTKSLIESGKRYGDVASVAQLESLLADMEEQDYISDKLAENGIDIDELEQSE